MQPDQEARLLLALALGGYSAEMVDGDDEEGATFFDLFVEESMGAE